ncbi:methyl-accepting chemotaxis protein [Gracilibacillus ureilyticus]|uniref:Methyl-accepting chemotaxis protein n=1 Tax=Gracilibacillus ureilyticus TaxID=531814 RepID=A0A1H9W2D8_9BACI|nr:methyl-accepting chemotaxis protein [Gracilibacillus ureilyticus]SES28018.1 methyl-accepting chemotaxis protein [Gracilibacillus ureilyticus]
MEKQKKGLSLRLKLVIFTTILAIVTYSTSAVFIYFLQEIITPVVPVSEVWYVLAVLLLGIFWSGVLAFVAAGFITKPLVRLKEIARKVAEGDLNQKIEPPRTTDDEIGALTISFQVMVDHLKTVLTDIEKHATETTESVYKMKEAASRSKQQAEVLEETIGHISQGAEETSEAIQLTAESVDNSTHLASRVDEKADESQTKSNEMVKQLTESNEIINGLVEGILHIAENQENALGDVNRLSQKAKEIENVISLVGDISEQTNLLALNASIEASRAGEEGKGFAVVAEEVRKLADQSSQAVQSISELIKDMQKDVELVVGSIQDQVNQTRGEMTKGQQTTEVLENMSGSIHSVAEAIKEISSLVDNQLKEIESAQEKSQNVAAIAEETSASAEEIQANIEEQANFAENLENLAIGLEKQAQNLKIQMEQFKLS